MQIDVREVVDDKITRIVFGEGGHDSDAFFISLNQSCTKIESRDSDVYIASEEDARNLIKALEKAIELKTWE